MRKKAVYFLVLFCVVIFLYGCPAEKEVAPIEKIVPATEESIKESNVTVFLPEHEIIFMVPDGNTLTFPIGSEVALIGVDAPSRGEPYFDESRDKLKSLVLDENVTLQRDISDMTYYGKYLRYVFINDIFVNEAMIRSGLAKAVIEEPNLNYSDLFYEAEIDAMSKRLFLWKDLEYDPCLFVAFFNYDAEGVDEFNLNDEFVTFRNICKTKIDLTGWKVQDSAEPYVFSDFILGPEAAVTLHSGEGQDSELHLYWGNELSVWDDYSDTLYLSNSNGDLIIKYYY